MSQFPGRVAKVILHAPGSIWRWDLEHFDHRRDDLQGFPFPKLRFLAALYLSVRNPDAAQNLVSQREAEGLAIPSIMVAFLLDQPDVVAPVDSDKDPRL